MKEFDYDAYLQLSDVHTGQIIDVASDLFSVAFFCRKNGLHFDPNCLIDSLVNLVGREGTVLIRAFSWRFCRGIPFQMNHTRSEVGALGTIAMSHREFGRTKHPLYSWFVYGNKKDELCENDSVESFGQGSIFAFLEENGATQLSIGRMRSSGLTIGHHAEYKKQVPYRRNKLFKGEYYDENDQISVRNYSMYVRPLNIEVENIFGKEETQEIFVEKGIKKNYIYSDALPISTIDLQRASAFITDDITNNDGKHTMMVNGIPGILTCGVNWNEAKY